MIDVAAIEKVYARAAERAAIGRRRLGRGLTLGEKILFNHLVCLLYTSPSPRDS